MDRLFQTTTKRQTIALDGQWFVTYDPDGRIGSPQDYRRHAGERQPVYVPSCWNFNLGRYSYVGAAWYGREFITDGPADSRLVFAAVSGQAEVYLDGALLGEHYGSYTPFAFDVPQLPGGRHELLVKVDNTVNDEDTLPLRYVDWFVYGGIYGPVRLERFDGMSIDNLKITTRWRAETLLYESGPPQVERIEVSVQAKNWRSEPLADTLELYVDEELMGCQDISLPAEGRQTVVFEVSSFAPDLWDCDHPRLYEVRVSGSVDDQIERTGFRHVATRGQDILLNGRKLFIKGVNRHNEHHELGYAINGPLIHRDMQIIAEMGCNAVRGSHYPNDPLVLDYCDQMGLLFWEELPFWNHPAESLARPKLGERARTMAREMIERDYNHPSIIFWSIQNESKSSSPQGRALFKTLAEDMRRLDDSRLLTFASACGREDICFDLVDVICWNMYPGWYSDDMSLRDMPTGLRDALQGHRQWLEDHHFDKPFIISEFGAGAVPGETTFHDDIRWTENYQEQLLDHALGVLCDCPAVQGFYIWQFCDIRTALMTKISIGRPRTFNNKGVVDERRRPKRAYYVVREHLRHKAGWLPDSLHS